MAITPSRPDTAAVLDRSLQAVCRHAHEQVLRALDPGGQDPLDAVAWSSAHLAAMDHEVYAVLRLRPFARAAVRRACAADRRLHAALWQLDRRLTGDLRLAPRPVADCADDVRMALAGHAEAEHGLISVLSPEEAERLGARVVACMERAPTRPHPHTPLTGPVSRLAFLVEGAVDRWRDAVDTRRTSAPRRMPAPLPAGRWAEYLAGAVVPGRDGRT